MKWFNFLIDNLKKRWGDKSSSHQLPGVLLVTRQGLRLPVTLVSSGLYAFSLLARKVKSLLHFRIAGLRVSDATLSRREQGASKRRAGLAIARGIGWAMILTGLSGAAYGYGLQADDGSDHYACRDRDRVISFNNVPSESDLDCLYNRDPDNLVYLPNNYPESSEYIQGNDDIQFYMDIQGGFWQTTLYFSHWEGEFVVRDGSGYCWVLERTADHSYIYLLREYLDGDSFALNNVYCVNNASTFHITSNPSVSIEENSTATVLDITVPPLAVGAEYLISEDADAAAFSIGLTSGTLSFVSPPDFETKNSYTFDVSATFGSLTTTQSITVTVTDVAEPPLITNPSPGSTLTGDTETITWIASAGMTGVIIDAGSSAYSNDYHSSGTLDPTVTNEVIMNLPTDGSPVYVTIWYKFPDIAWQRVLHEFTALDDGSTGGSSTSATIISHTSGDTLTSSEQTFIWSDVGADEYLLQIGSAQGSSSILSTGYITSTERFVSNLPTGGSQIFVSLWTIHDGQWNPSYSSYWAVNIQGSAPTITSLNTGDTLTSSEQTFTWSDVGASNYWLQIGSSVDRNDIYDSGMLTTNTEQLVSNLPTDGSPIYVRIWYRNNGQWHDIKDSYTAVNIPGSGEPTPPTITSLNTGDTLTSAEQTFTWSDVGASSYWLQIGSDIGRSNIYDSGVLTSTEQSVSDLPTDGSPIYVQIWYQNNGQWDYIQDSYMAVNIPGSGEPTPPTMTSLNTGDTLTSAEQTFTWSDVGASSYWLQIGSDIGRSNIYDSGVLTSTEQSVSDLPTDGSPIYVRIWYQNNGQWDYIQDSYMAMNIPGSGEPTPPTMTSLNTGDTLTSSEQTFTWSDVGASSYWLQIGSDIGRSNIYDSGVLTSTEQSVSDLPTDGSTIYVRIWYQNNGQWDYIQDSYMAMNIPGSGEPTPPTMTSLNTGDTLTSSEQTFIWSDVGVSDYWLQIGSGVGRSDYHDSGILTTVEQSVSDLPTDGSPIYVRVWYKHDGQWDYIDENYLALNTMITIPSGGTSCNAVAGVMSGWKSAYCDATFTYLGEAYRPVLWTRLYFGDGIEYVIGSMQGPSTTFEPMPGDTRLGNSNGSSKTVEAGACTSTYPTDPTNGSLFVAQSVFCFYFLTDTHLITLQATTGEDTYAVLSNVMGAYYPR